MIRVLFADMSKVQDDEVGDGTTSVTVLAAELLRVNILIMILKRSCHHVSTASVLTNTVSLGRRQSF